MVWSHMQKRDCPSYFSERQKTDMYVCVCDTGVYSIGGAALLGIDVGGMLSAIGSTSIIGPLAKASVIFPLVYHYLGAARHFVWDYYPETVHNESAEKSSYAMFGASGLAALVGAIM